MKKNILSLVIALLLVLLPQTVFAVEGEEEHTTANLSPRIIAESYKVDGDVVSDGDFKFNAVLKNTSKNIDVQNVLISISGGEAFSVSKGTEFVYTDQISSSGTFKFSKNLVCSSNCETGSYPINVSVSYEYFDNGEKASGTSDFSIGINVKKKAKADVITFDGLELADKTINTNQESDCAFQLTNTGQTKLSNGRVILKDENGNELVSAFIGNIEPGTQFTSNYTLPVTFADAGVKNLTIVFEYDNEDSEKKSIEQQFRVTVEEYQDPFEDIHSDSEAEIIKKTSPVVPIVCAVVGVIVLAVAAVVIAKIVKKKKAQKGSDFIDEEI